MKVRILAAAFAISVAIPLSGAAAPPERDGLVFVGFSADPVLGSVGYAGMNGACQGTFGAAARMATTKEYITAPNAVAPSTHAWINTEIIGGSGSTREVVDFSGHADTPERLNCRAWSQFGEFGMTVTPTSSLDNVSGCTSMTRPVACSVPGK